MSFISHSISLWNWEERPTEFHHFFSDRSPAEVNLPISNRDVIMANLICAVRLHIIHKKNLVINDPEEMQDNQ